MLVEDNKAVADRWNNRRPQVLEELESKQHSAPCLDDLADSDLWAAIDREIALWGGRLKLLWNRGHPEKRKHKTSWTRHEHGNSWSDIQADDAREALVHKLEGSTSRMELVDPSDWLVSVVAGGEGHQLSQQGNQSSTQGR